MKKSSKQKTSKRVKVVGTQQWLNPATNKMEDFQVVQMEDRDFNFHKVWMQSIISALDLIGNQKTKLAFWIIDNLDKENQLTYTQRQIVEVTGISLDTVNKTIKALIDCNFLRRKNGGCYVVNPDVIFKGSRNGRLNVLLQYQNLDSSSDPEHDEAEQEDKPQEIIEPTCEDEEPVLFPEVAAAVGQEEIAAAARHVARTVLWGKSSKEIEKYMGV